MLSQTPDYSWTTLADYFLFYSAVLYKWFNIQIAFWSIVSIFINFSLLDI